MKNLNAWKPAHVLRKLLGNTRGNSLMLVAGAAIPLVVGVGGAVDMGRVYATGTKLQSACDAAVLGGRQSMVGSAWTAQNRNVADNFFHNNFPTGKYGSESESITYVAAANGELTATAIATLPMSIMSMFGVSAKDFTVTCKAQKQMGNTDIMFVLDTTGSMAQVDGDAVSRMDEMRTAVRAFHGSINPPAASGVQVRYGFVPYSSNVNVGYLLNADWMADSATYQSRIPRATTGTTENLINFRQTSDPETLTYEYTNLTNETCEKQPDTVDWGTPVTVSPAGSGVLEVRRQRVHGNRYFLEETVTTCRLVTQIYDEYFQEFDVEVLAAGANTLWSYEPVSYDVSSLKGLTSGGSITARIGDNFTDRTINWNGCIEERQTVHDSDYSPIPADALDLNIDLVPTPGSPETQWKPFLPQLIYARESMDNPQLATYQSQWGLVNIGDLGTGSSAACPTEARRLAPMTATDVNSYLDSLVPVGGTYHDIGMLWGARLLSPTGLFGADNTTASNGSAIARHLIFMTDGVTDTSPLVADAYGWPALDRRRSADTSAVPTKADQDNEVEARLAALCAATRGKNITIWVVAFGTDLTSNLSNCSGSDHAFEASNATELNAAFNDIARQISNLRLTR